MSGAAAARVVRGALFLSAALTLSFSALAQGARIASLDVLGLVPFSVAFEVEGEAGALASGARGTVTLSDASGRDVDQFAVGPFALVAGRTRVEAASRWEFQLAGSYLVRAALDLGEGTLVAASRKLEILPVRLPRAAATTPVASDACVMYQTPVNWGLEKLHVPEAWALTHGDASVVVAVIDSGIDSSVPQLVGSLWTNDDEVPNNGRDDDRNGYIDDVHGWDFRDDDPSSLVGSPIHRHGTSVASIIAAQPGRYPIVGVAPGVRLMDVRFLDSMNQFATSDWDAFERAVNYAVDNGADIINLSIYATALPPRSFERALDRARVQGVFIVGISGNLGADEVAFPGRYDSVLAVSAITRAGLVAGFSNRGPEVDFCAPGESIPSLTLGGRVASDTGTSFAAPHIAGVLALMLSVDPALTVDEATDILSGTATDLGGRGRDNLYGRGLVNAWAALVAATTP